MSHFTSIKTKMADKVLLLKALDDMAYPYEEGKGKGLQVRGWRGNTLTADVVLASKTSGYDIGFVKRGDNYEAVADWSMIREDWNQFLGKLNQRYAYHATCDKLAEQGFTLAEESQEDGRIHLVARRVV